MGLDAGLAPTGEWECMECGYIEVGAEAKRPKMCPDCGALGQALEFFPYGDEDDRGEAVDDLDEDLFEDGVDLDEGDDVR